MINGKWGLYATGLLSGVAVAAAFGVAFHEGAPAAYAQSAGASGGVANMSIISGGAQQQTFDMAWVFSVNDHGNKHVTLYQCANGRALKLIAARDITWDMEIVQLGNEGPSVTEVKKKVEDEIKNREKALNGAASEKK